MLCGLRRATATALRRAHARNAVPVMVRSLFIRTEDTPNPNSRKFIPPAETEVLPRTRGTGVFFQGADRDYARRQSPLATHLLDIDGVVGVFLGNSFITVTKQDDAQWGTVNPSVFATVMDFFTAGAEPVMHPEAEAEAADGSNVGVSDTAILDDDDEVVAMIKELIETRVRPAVQEDGGDIYYRGFDEETGIVSLQLAGSCSGCPSSQSTLKGGVEQMLMHYIPEVTGVQEYEDEELAMLNMKEFEETQRQLRETKAKMEARQEEAIEKNRAEYAAKYEPKTADPKPGGAP